MTGITKVYPGVVALDDVNLDLEAGEVHALLGENGAGKTTLMSILFGLSRSDRGLILLEGRPVEVRSAKMAIALGIGMVHQHQKLVPNFTGLENIALARVPTWRSPRPRLDVLRAAAEEKRKRYGLEVDLERPVAELTLAGRQSVEILKTLLANARILILDEPTAILSPPEAAVLFGVLNAFTKAGGAVCLITHKLPEAMDFSHRVSVLRSGRLVWTGLTRKTTARDLVRSMVGRTIVAHRRTVREPACAAHPALRVRNLEVQASGGREGLRGVSFDVLPGEILGIAGVDGNGQRSLFDSLSGLCAPAAGLIEMFGVASSGLDPAALRNLPIGRVADDRESTGLFVDRTIRDNLILLDYRKAPLSRAGFISPGRCHAMALRLMRDFAIKAAGPLVMVRRLSGGNRQKVLLARELHHRPALLIIANPFRGLDVGASEYVFELIEEQRRLGSAVLLISADLDEILTLSDRVAVLYRGVVAGILSAEGVSRERIGALMAGGI